MEQNIHWTSLYLPSNARCISEFELLNKKLQVQLKADLKRVYNEAIYTDLEISFDNGLIQTHSSLLRCRAPKFFSELCCSASSPTSAVILAKVDQFSIESFVRDIYSQNKIKEKEISVVEYLARFRPVKEDVLTPESDEYVTPETSPTDAHYSFGHARSASDTSLVKASPSDNKRLHSTNPLYYSLVTVDEVYPCESADILEKELAEQDQLFKSFKSIISRDTKGFKSENKTGLKLSQSHISLRCGSPKHRNVNKSLELKLLAKLSSKDTYSFKNSDTTIKNQLLKNVVPTICHLDSTNIPAQTKENSDVCNCRKIKGFCDGSKPCEITIMSKPRPEIDEVVESESNGGPDSCLEAGSSGYLTGSSPREYTVSDPYVGDLTEVATSDDIPHDNDQSARSSSMSSDAGTWDSTFPAVSEGTVKENVTENKTKRLVQLGDHDSSFTIANEHKTTLETVTVCNSTCSVQSNSVVNGVNKAYLPSADNPLVFSDGGARDYYERNSSKNRPEKDVSDSSLSGGEMAFKNKEDKLCSGKNNFFIDAASLLDENEMSSIPPNSLSFNGYESQDGSPWSGTNVGKSAQASGQPRVLNDVKPNDMQSTEQSDVELRRGSLIRRNTFELELDDERLEKLRVKCEKHKEKSPHHMSTSLSASNGGGAQFSLAGDDCKQKPNSLPVQLDPFAQTQKVEDEVHSPDSLNNDGPLYHPVDNHNEQVNCYSLPFEVNHFSDVKDYSDHKMNLYSGAEESLTNYLGGNRTDTESANTSGNLNSFNKDISYNLESIPILSGGICPQDVTPEKVFSSPLMNRRKTESTPILSGAAIVEPEPVQVPKMRSNSSFSTSWVVDMGELNKSSENEKENTKETSMDSNLSEDFQKQSKSSNSSLGYFISLDSPTDDKENSQIRTSTHQTKDSEKAKEGVSIKAFESKKIDMLSSNTNQSSCSSSSCGFYVDLKDSPVCTEKPEEKESAPDKKLFSMFIDIGDSNTTNGSKSSTSSPHVFKKRNHNRTLSGVFPKTTSRLNESQKSSQSSLDTTESFENLRETPRGRESAPIPQTNSFDKTPNSSTKVEDETSKQGLFMFIETDNSPLPQRRVLPSGQVPSSQRHSWNSESHNVNLPITVNNGTGNSTVKRNHRRSHSVSVNKSLEVMFNVEQNENKSSSASPLVKGSTSNSLGYESGPSSIDESGVVSKCYNKRMMASWHGPVKPSAELQKVIAKGDLKEKEARTIYKKHSLDATSEIADELCDSIDKSDEICQSQTESKGDDTYDISNTSNESSNIHNSTFIVSDISNVANATSNDLELTTPTCDIVSQLSKDDSDKTETDFDDGRDKKSGDIPRTPDHSMSLVEVPPVETKFSFVKLSDMDKEPKKIALEGKSVSNRMSRSIPEASWIETKMMTRSATSRSLSRLFPHLNRNPTPDSAEKESDYSELSSMQSSMDPSALEGSTEDDASAGAGGPVSRLGEDLLRMFLDEISPDVTVEVGGRRIKAHKCILSSRCQYFAAILSGGWVESAGNVISLQGFSYSAVHFALCHIYSGVSNIPDSINIVELATLADMLCLEGLKEVIMYTLKVKYCHFFHKPCPMCTVGVLECLPLAAAYGLDEIYRKSLRWIAKHFVRVWPTKGFATLPRELLDKCYKQHVVHMTVENVLDTVLCCHKLQGLIPNVRWAEPVFSLATKLYEATVKFIAQHFCEILSSDTFMSLGRDQAWSAGQLEETLVSAAERLPPDQACRSHSHLHKLSAAMTAAPPDTPLRPSDGFSEFVRLLSTSVEGCLLRQAARASRTPAWALMEPQLRHRIQDAACLVIVPGDDRRRARHLAKRTEAVGNGKRPVELLPAKTTVPDFSAPKKHNSAVRISAPPAATAKPKTPQPTNKAENNGPRPKTWPYKITEVKSRYLEPKATPKPSPAAAKPEKTTPARRATSKSIISSSDSSRTSSPAMRRAGAPRASRSLPSKRDESLTMSTDSLTDPAISGQKKRADTITKSQSTASRIDFVERNIKSLSLKSVRASSGDKAKPLRAEDKPKFSPVPVSKKASTQSSPHVRDSPSAVKSTVNSTPSPSLRRNTLSPKDKTAEAKSGPLKRTSTYRVAPKASSPMKVSARSRETDDASSNHKNINKIQTVAASKKSVANNNLISDNRKTDKPQPMVGSRSGTFLKDEPTVLKKPQVVDLSE